MTVFEFLDTEKKLNFENESHIYVQQHHDYSFENADLQTVPHFDITSAYPIRFCFDSAPIPSKDYLIYQKTFIQPPDRLFLLHSSFLIWCFFGYNFGNVIRICLFFYFKKLA